MFAGVTTQSLYVDGDPAATAANLIDNATLARIGIGVDLALVITQTMAALWFYRLFRHIKRHPGLDSPTGIAAQGGRSVGCEHAVDHP